VGKKDREGKDRRNADKARKQCSLGEDGKRERKESGE
jgi:hypothetical protein